MRHAFTLFYLFLSFYVSPATAEEAGKGDLELGDEYSEHSKNHSKNKEYKKNERSFLVSTLLFIPNRVLDLVDIIRFDVGVGPALGAVVRVTPYGQAGVRFVMPVSLRAGLRGRKMPVFIDHTNEMGVGPLFLGSKDREPTPLEVGVGGDLLLVGAYAGVSIDSIFDFLGGFVGLDISDDDI
jgi:hypothetical protein